MSTRSLIGIDNKDGTVTYVYCHWDGYPSGVGKTLQKYYNTPELARAVTSGNDIRALAPFLQEIDCFDTNLSRGTIPIEEYLCSGWRHGANYIYLYDKYGWYVTRTTGYSLGLIEQEDSWDWY